MAFSFGAQTPAASPFGAASTPVFGQASTPAFGAPQSSTSLFGAAPTPAFGAPAASSSGFSFGGASAPASSGSLFGASSAPAFGATPGAAVSTPAFSFSSAPASTPSLFGAPASTPALGTSQPAPAFGFGSSTPSLFGASSTPSLFGASSAPSLFGGALAGSSAPSLFGATSTPLLFGAPASTPSLFGAAPAAAAVQQQVSAGAQQLVTKDGRPITHSTKWDDLSPQAQNYLLELEKVVVQYREECKQLDGDARLAGGAAAAATRDEEGDAPTRTVRQAIASLAGDIQADLDQVAALREVVMHLHRATESAVHTFKRSYAWREAAKAAAGGGAAQVAPLEYMAGPVVLPSQFLRDAIAGFLEKLRQHKASAAELEAVLGRPDGGGGMAAGNPGASLQALQGALHNVHDALIHAAAKLQAVDDRVQAAKAAALARLRAAGDGRNPFEEAEREVAARRELGDAVGAQHRKPVAATAAQAGAAAGVPAGFAPSPAAGAPGSPLPLASPGGGGGLFGTVPAAGFGTPLFPGGQFGKPGTGGSSRKPSSRKR